MKPIIDIKEMQSIQIDIMRKIHEFCEEKGISYYMSHGSLIGAIRHRGFIPWDDDIDIFMTREEYEQFCEVFPLEQERYGLELANSKTSIYLGRPMSKIIDCRTVLIEPEYLGDDQLGVNIDIWPLDGVPKSKPKRTIHFLVLRVLIGILYKRISRYRSFGKMQHKLIHLLLLPIPSRWIIDIIEALLKKYKCTESDEICCYVDPYVRTFKKECFSHKRLCQFEGDAFCVPSGAEEVLTILYGDYMKLPPKDKQVAHHIVDVYWK